MLVDWQGAFPQDCENHLQKLFFIVWSYGLTCLQLTCLHSYMFLFFLRQTTLTTSFCSPTILELCFLTSAFFLHFFFLPAMLTLSTVFCSVPLIWTRLEKQKVCFTDGFSEHNSLLHIICKRSGSDRTIPTAGCPSKLNNYRERKIGERGK